MASQRAEEVRDKLLANGYLTTQDLVVYLREWHPHAYISHPTMYRFIKAVPPMIEAMKIGNQWRVRREEVERFIQFGNKSPPAKAGGGSLTPVPKPEAVPDNLTAADLIKMGRRYERSKP